MGTLMSQNDPKGFWNKRARTFPRYSADENSYEAGILKLAREHGVVFRNKKILDVGCGSGMYTVRLALEAEKVIALDISDEMLAVLRADAEALGLRNITYVHSNWLDYHDEEKPEQIFCSMTPALTTDEGKEKVAAASGAEVVFIGWNGGMHSSVMAGLYEHYQITPDVLNTSPPMKQWLDSQGLQYQALPVEGQWRVPFTKDDLAWACLNTLDNYGRAVDRAHLDDYLERFRQADGSYLEITDYKIEMLIWSNR